MDLEEMEPCPDPECDGKAVKVHNYLVNEDQWRCGECGVWWSKEEFEKSNHNYEE